MTTTAENTLLSGILSATTGMVKSLNAMMVEQKQQGKQIAQVIKDNEEMRKRLDVLETDMSQLTTQNDQQWRDISKQTTQLADKRMESVHTLLNEKLTTLVEVITDEDEKEKMTQFLEDMSHKLLNKTDAHQKLIVDKLDNMNQLELLKNLIDSLCVMQNDMSSLAKSLVTTIKEVSDLQQTNALMSSRLESIDIRLASFVAGKEDVQDKDLDTLNDALSLLEQLNVQTEETI